MRNEVEVGIVAEKGEIEFCRERGNLSSKAMLRSAFMTRSNTLIALPLHQNGHGEGGG